MEADRLSWTPAFPWGLPPRLALPLPRPVDPPGWLPPQPPHAEHQVAGRLFLLGGHQKGLPILLRHSTGEPGIPKGCLVVSACAGVWNVKHPA